MLIPVEDGPAVVACNTCRHSSTAKEDDAGVRGGARMVEALRAGHGAHLLDELLDRLPQTGEWA